MVVEELKSGYIRNILEVELFGIINGLDLCEK